MELTRNFKNLSKDDTKLAGGKGASLGEMTQAGIPVPPGFVVLAGIFEKFLTETDLNIEIDAILHTVDHNAMHTVEEASEKIQKLIKDAKMPKDIAQEIEKQFVQLDTEFVAVRSSATAEDGAENAWAGQLDSYLNTTKKDLLEKVQHCWASLFTPRAIFYRFEKNLHKQKISVAVVVQKMVASEISGIAFSVHPVTEDYNQLIIEAGFGLGEAIVSGQITPDSYVVEKEPRNILDINVSTQSRGIYRAKNGGNEWRDIAEPQASSQVLTQDQILELSEIILGIEKHYGFPCDIEWAFEDGKFYIVQSRPITTLMNNKTKDKSIIYSELIHVDLPLITAELTNFGETIKDVPWSDKKFEFSPYCIFQRKNESLHFYYDTENGMQWKIREAGKFDKEKMKREVRAAFNSIKDAILKEKTLEREDFIEFIEKLKSFWTWWDCMWWMIEYCDQNNLEMADLMSLRKETEHLTPGIAAVIRNSLKKIFPNKKEFVDVISIAEVKKNILPDDIVLKKRLDGFIYTNGRLYDSIAVIENEFGIKIKTEEILSQDLHGQVAYKGLARGRVRIIRRNSSSFNYYTGFFASHEKGCCNNIRTWRSNLSCRNYFKRIKNSLHCRGKGGN